MANPETTEERKTRQDKNDQSDQRFGAFVTNKYVVSVLVALVMTMGGYIFKTSDKTTDAQAAQLQALDRRVNAVEVQGARTEAQYGDIIRRLDRIENAVYATSPFRRSGQFTPVPSGKPTAP